MLKNDDGNINSKVGRIILSFTDEKTEQNLTGLKTQTFHTLSRTVPFSKSEPRGNKPNKMTHCYLNITCLHQGRKAHFGKRIKIIITKMIEKLVYLKGELDQVLYS